MEKSNKEEVEEKRGKIIDNFVEMMKIQDPEKQTSVRQLFKVMLKHLEKGLTAEVRTPSLIEPEKPSEENDENKKEFQEKQKAYELKKEIDEKNKEIFILQQNNFYGMNSQFLDMVGDEDEEKREDDNNKTENK